MRKTINNGSFLCTSLSYFSIASKQIYTFQKRSKTNGQELSYLQTCVLKCFPISSYEYLSKTNADLKLIKIDFEVRSWPVTEK